ncbi:pilus assembly protein N-terminal domain-containing protein [Magnetospirillum sp. UT-4]|uniref:pilus assembly protein N-terminal domain-containing protein n=1 Tax=Magnetospirillum sp. UT-4 TaxID=2681467 RepID=UPI001381B159|nr:pilus assembly protein N-terminal domain-containing protein [Magnetospirillum sp. UT-4]CAA7625895.1 putative CpaC-related secretion pathway protein [Magnetospirillum sp. UT-4]
MSRLQAFALAAAFAALSPAAAADAPIEVGAGHAALVTLAKPARSVVVGDPTVADVSVEGPNRLAVFGKRPGGTTLTVLGGGRAVLLEARVVVHPGGAGAVTVTYGAGKGIDPGGRTVVYACGSSCSRAVEGKEAAAR